LLNLFDQVSEFIARFESVEIVVPANQLVLDKDLGNSHSAFVCSLGQYFLLQVGSDWAVGDKGS